MRGFTPGPNNTLCATLAANFGLKPALCFVLSVALGWGAPLFVCASGLGALVVALPPLRWAITACGVAYFWIAWRLWRTRQMAQADASHLNLTFWQDAMLQFLNIKAWMLALTIVASWLAGRPEQWRRFAAVLPLLLGFALASKLSYAFIGSPLCQWLADTVHGGRRLRWFNRAMAMILLATATWMTTI